MLQKEEQCCTLKSYQDAMKVEMVPPRSVGCDGLLPLALQLCNDQPLVSLSVVLPSSIPLKCPLPTPCFRVHLKNLVYLQTFLLHDPEERRHYYASRMETSYHKHPCLWLR